MACTGQYDKMKKFMNAADNVKDCPMIDAMRQKTAAEGGDNLVDSSKTQMLLLEIKSKEMDLESKKRKME